MTSGSLNAVTRARGSVRTEAFCVTQLYTLCRGPRLSHPTLYLVGVIARAHQRVVASGAVTETVLVRLP